MPRMTTESTSPVVGNRPGDLARAEVERVELGQRVDKDSILTEHRRFAAHTLDGLGPALLASRRAQRDDLVCSGIREEKEPIGLNCSAA